MTVAQKIRELIEKHFVNLDDKIQLNDDDNIFDRGFVDSLFAMQLVNFIEMEFHIQLDNEDLDLANFSSIKRIVSFIENKKGM
jgi:acyl carrier protein